MFKNKKLSKNPLHYVYAMIWLVLFGSIAYYVYSGAAFKPENGKIHLVAILIAWVVEYLGLTLLIVWDLSGHDNRFRGCEG